MKYMAYMQDKEGNCIDWFWFRSQHNTLSMDKVLESAENIANERDYYYDNIFVGRKNK